ncbi:hypothetical protein Cgig2_011603 [Carnegiea gigantea]|uniref:Beta-taxilin n=1 Tax=Carnegiea gigantea TaxID=171969 RepID=A0A9Q1GLF0_9CARY|nr:hypothetical protein Cgig2_011603 [Carnegiea gigantea]
MENSPANQLPEVDSLPDGFVEGPSISLAPRTPSNEQEKPCADYKEDKLSESDTLNYSSNEVSASEFIPVEEKADKVRKLRTFPVPLSDKDDYDASRESANVSDEGFLNEREDALVVNSESSTSVSKVSTECYLGTSTTDGKEKYQSEVQSSTKDLGFHSKTLDLRIRESIVGVLCGKQRAFGRLGIATRLVGSDRPPLAGHRLLLVVFWRAGRPISCEICSCSFRASLLYISVGSTTAEANIAKMAQLSDNEKTRKEMVEGKRKNSKRTFKTEQEFLEFTLKYQQVLAERDAAIAVRDKLESLCRELQRQNKMLMDECKKVSEEGQNLRLDLSTKFQDAIKDVSNRLEEQKGECLSQLKENEMLRDKLKQLADQYTLAQQQYAQELKQKTLELKIAELKIQQNEEKLAHEQEQMKLYAEKISQLLETEKSLRLQLTADGEKFQQFQDALVKSNEVFETFKQEIEKMSKLTKELKKENTFLKSKCEKSDYTLVELVEERERMKKQLEKTKNQKEKLESLCRSLQAERKQSSDSTV